jgi:predicted TIM-barrel fold metal-dependent hydrolase
MKMSDPHWGPCALDTRIWEEELNNFVPARVFDVHTHLHDWTHYTDPAKATGPYAPSIGTYFPRATKAIADAVDAALMPGREVDRLSFPFPYPRPIDTKAANALIAAEVSGAPRSAGLMLVQPEMTVGYIRATLARTGLIGLKPYLVYARGAPTTEARITDFLPEPQIALADELGLIIMMHLSKRDAIADPDNIRDLRDLTERYPGAKWCLAHCARSYSAWAIEAAAASLRGIPNIWYDTSTVCEADALDALYTGVGVDRVMYGSDDLIGPMRGKYIAFGRAWSLLHPGNHSLTLGHCLPDMTFIRYEQLRAMKRGSRQIGLTEAQRKALFHDTARALVDSVPRH